MDIINNLIDEIIDGYSRSEGEERADAEVEETEGGESSAEELLEVAEELYAQDRIDEAVDIWKRLAEKGVIFAQYRLGVCYYDGEGVARDYGIAAQLYEKSAKQGYAPALYNLGVCYRTGKGVEQNYGEAAVWFKAAAEAGDACGQFSYAMCLADGVGVEEDNGQAINLVALSAEQVYAPA